MKALIIGAGQGKRLLPLTETTPKALIKIGGKSLFEWQLDALVECGVSEVVFVAGFNIGAVRQEADTGSPANTAGSTFVSSITPSMP